MNESCDELRKSFDNATTENAQLTTQNAQLRNDIEVVKTELKKFKTDDAPPELQVKSAGEVPYIKSEYLYKQLDDIGLDVGNLDTRLTLIARLTKKKSYFGGTSENFFFEFNVPPPPEEKMFTANLENTTVEIPFPAVLFLRCEQNDKNFQINGVYVVSSNTRMERRTNPYEVDLNGLIRLETKKEYTDRANKNVPVKMLDGTFRPLVLKIKGREVNITFPNPDQTQIQNLENAIEKEKKNATGAFSDYALHRFNIDDVSVDRIKNFVKNVTSVGPSKPIDVSKGVASTAISAAKLVVNKLVGSGKRRRNVKHKTKKMKCKKCKKNNNRKTKVKMG